MYLKIARSRFETYRPFVVEAYRPQRRQAFVADHDTGFVHKDEQRRELIVAIAGSNDPADWSPRQSGNAHLSAVHVGDGLYAHAGFHQAAEAIAATIMQDVYHWVLQSDTTLTFCGHSRGGAIAQILPIVMGVPPQRVRVVAFGAPRCLFEAPRTSLSALMLSREVILFEHAADPVPLFPLKTLRRPWRRYGAVVIRGLLGGVRVQSAGQETISRRVSRVAAVLLYHHRHAWSVSRSLLGLAGLNRLRDSLHDAHAMAGGYATRSWWPKP